VPDPHPHPHRDRDDEPASILILGQGAREHALAVKLATSPRAGSIVVAPGNAGTAREFENAPLSAIDHFPEMVNLVDELKPGLVIIGPEAPLVAGLADILRGKHVRVFGPGNAGARLEGSKAYAKQFFLRYGLPTSPCELFADAKLAHAFLDQSPTIPVVKPDGLTAGKGVVVAETRDEAHEAVERMLGRGELGDAGRLVLLEAPVRGEEVSLTLLLDGKRFLVLPPARDHKRLLAGDKGPNTGGMGAIAPSSRIDERVLDALVARLVLPLLQGLHKEGIDYRGALTLGLSLDEKNEPTLLEINARFGDPELCAQVGIIDEDLLPLLADAADGTLARSGVVSSSGHSAAVVLTRDEYPHASAEPVVLTGLDEAAESPGVYVFHGGTRENGNEINAVSGRIVTVSATGETAEEARAAAYEAAARIDFVGKRLREDVGSAS
jgi:phosphoribosylamine---glycine ligase